MCDRGGNGIGMLLLFALLVFALTVMGTPAEDTEGREDDFNSGVGIAFCYLAGIAGVARGLLSLAHLGDDIHLAYLGRRPPRCAFRPRARTAATTYGRAQSAVRNVA